MSAPSVDGVELARWLGAQFAGRADVRGVLLVGSYARGAATPSSDVDLVVLTDNPRAYRDDVRWHEALPWAELGVAPVGHRDGDHGAAWSRHVALDSGLVVEIGFAAPDWAAIHPADPGTLAVMRGGHLILHDPEGALAALATAL